MPDFPSHRPTANPAANRRHPACRRKHHHPTPDNPQPGRPPLPRPTPPNPTVHQVPIVRFAEITFQPVVHHCATPDRTLNPPPPVLPPTA